ncbi:MAG: ATP-binding protein [Defluviitaleaceae bacterium]|nr:ATP-binding protein [Defluviitaleaceae bacterium]
MGQYVNPGCDKFEMSLNSEIYIDKSNLIAKTNAFVRTERRFICISRPRRFGKTMAANMLAAYYGAGEDTHRLFGDLNIAADDTYEKHLNKYHVIMINMQEFLSRTNTVTQMLTLLQSKVIKDLQEIYPTIKYDKMDDFIEAMKDTYQKTKRPFIILLDEWDCLFREYKNDHNAQKKYLDFLRLWLKDQAYVGLAYMTGILPIKKYGSHSALNMFDEYSMTSPSQFINYFGFTASEVEQLSHEYQIDLDEIEKWYNGYFTELGNSIYNPRSVTSCLTLKEFDNYWNKTETYEALKDYIKLNFDGLRDKVTRMLSGESIGINTRRFKNDMTTMESADDILTLLVHLGYLTYNFKNKTISIPNEEVKDEFVTAIESLNWTNVVDALRESDKLLKAIWNQDADLVAEGIGKVHEQNTSILQYNNENALSCVISLALYCASEYYTVVRELPTGKGYSDLVFMPRQQHSNKPALVVELKWNQTAEGAIHQIKHKNYPVALETYQGNLLLVGINYDKKDKTHTCVIESIN